MKITLKDYVCNETKKRPKSVDAKIEDIIFYNDLIKIMKLDQDGCFICIMVIPISELLLIEND